LKAWPLRKMNPWRLVQLNLLLLVAILVVSCEKEPGKGGLASISGKVYARDINALGEVHDSGYGGELKVYLSYGDNAWVDESESTSETGEYRFQGLQKGDYRIVTYSRCDTCLLNQVPVEQAVSITKTKQIAVLPDFVVYE
jgi:hypothetical protein